LISICIFTLSFQCVWLIFRRISKAEQRMAQMVGAVFTGFCLFSLARISVIIAFPYSTNDFFQSGLYETLILLAYQILLILLTFSLVLMVNQKLQNEVQQEEEKFSRAFRSSPYAIMLTRADDGQILEVNDGFSAITGFRPDEVLGKTTQELHLWVNADDRAIVTSELKKGNSVRGREFLFRKKNDQIVIGLISADIIMIKEQPWILSSIEDISDRKKAEQAIKDYSGHLEEMVAARTGELQAAQEKLVKHERLVVLGQLSGSVGHELRAPLGVIANAVYFLKMAQPEADPKIREYHDILQSEVNNADKIITDLLDYSRVRSADRTAFSIGEACQNVLERYPVPKGIKVNLEISEPLPKAFADPKQIAQVLGNLALNAYQAMPEGGELAISARQKGKTIAVSVEDTGVGISAKNMEQLFDPLFTTKPRGIGLGLTVSKMLMEANNGRIAASSNEGKGSVFTIFVPIQEEKQ
jgi:PAS domain S-box-containing protein